ncbi:transcription factor IBH1-like 1 [Chenopodium quinoa]|uniref:transcription factor IBH1-like 1 n=1 Tax=Chenopodium quinoa TaxID=63459 RepID=UPI000B76ED70|nr:transcription factor IBH1-like 1 [Chenopodium quinoa]
MHTHKSLKKEFLKKWITSLQICSSSKENMNLLERKKAIKLSADLAMASTRNGKRSWSRALIIKASKDRETGNLAKQILGDKTTYKCFSQDDLNATTLTTTTTTTTTKPKSRTIFVQSNKKKPTCSRNIRKFRKCDPKKCGVSNSNKVKKARAMAKRLVEKRTQILKGLIPGGEYMDEYSLVKETLDYVVSLRAQVDVMQYLANSPQLFIHI